MAAEAARDPQARRKLADLRHAMQGVAEHARPYWISTPAELRIELLDVGLELGPVRPRISLPGGGRPENNGQSPTTR